MNRSFFNSEHTRTPFVQLDTRKCKACWKCLYDCSGNVIGKVDLPWHKHALIIEPNRCTGCLKCLKACQYGAYSKVDKTNQKAVKKLNGVLKKFIINNLLLTIGLAMILSGFALQFGFHMGSLDDHHGGGHSELSQPVIYEQTRGIDTIKTVWGLNYSGWSTTHKWIIFLFSLLMVYHIYDHWKWYKVVITKHLAGKNKQVITLSVLFLLVAITGLVPWMIDLSGSSNMLRIFLIEIHDKLALILFVYLALHVIRRMKWFANAYRIVRS